MFRRRLVAVLGVAVLTVGLAGCSDSTEVSVSSGPTASSAPDAGSSLEPADFAAALKRPGTTLLDVRTPAEFADGHLEGAVNIDVESADFPAQAAQLDPGATYAVYCHSGNRSKTAMNFLAGQGFTSMFDLAGGITAWTGDGGATVTD
jgi:phage shock protein E